MSCPNHKRFGCTCSDCAAALVASERSRLPSPATTRTPGRTPGGAPPTSSPASVSAEPPPRQVEAELVAWAPVPAWVSRHAEVLDHFRALHRSRS
jgi:hypothetical protein